jgi:uncharacterized protein
MRLVVDTNVLVSALLSPGRVPDRALAALCERGDIVLYDHRIVAEYRAVLSRPKFRAIDPARASERIAALLAVHEDLGEVAPFGGELIDPDDRAFVEVALAGAADAIVTGNSRHYPIDLGFEVLTPAALLDRFARP